MVSYQRLKTECFGRCCRTCINQHFHLKLKSEDCDYLWFSYPCAICGEKKNIVSDVVRFKRIKLMRGRNRKRVEKESHSSFPHVISISADFEREEMLSGGELPVTADDEKTVNVDMKESKISAVEKEETARMDNPDVDVKAPQILKLVGKEKGFKVVWKKKNVTGYELCYATKKNFTGKKTVKIGSAKTTSKKITKLKGNTKYYVKLRSYKTVGGKKYYSKWSSVKSVKTKK